MRDQVKVGPGEALRILAGFRSEAIDKLNEHTDAIERHVERFIALDKRVTEIERYVSSLEGVHVNASIKHADRIAKLEAQQRTNTKAIGLLTAVLRELPSKLSYVVNLIPEAIDALRDERREADGGR